MSEQVIRKKYEVYLDGEKIGSDMRIDDALIFAKALAEVYTPMMAVSGCGITIKLTEESMNGLTGLTSKEEEKEGEE